MQTRVSDVLATTMAAGASTCTLSAGNFGSPVGKQIITIDYNVAAKAADFLCTIAGTAVTAMVRLNGPDVEHASNAAVAMNLVDEHANLIFNALDNGWVDPVETPTKGTGSTLVFTGVDRTSTYEVGDKVMYTDTTVKFGYITSSVFSTDTTLTITGGSDYALVGSPTAGTFYYSKASSPVGFPTAFNISTATTFRMEGRMAIVEGWSWVVGDGSATASKTITHGFNFGSAPERVQICGLGRTTAADPTSIADFTASAAIACNYRSITGTSFIAFLWAIGTTYSSSDRLGFSFRVSSII